MVYHHLAKFGGHRCCSSIDMFLVCHVIKQDLIIKGFFIIIIYYFYFIKAFTNYSSGPGTSLIQA